MNRIAHAVILLLTLPALGQEPTAAEERFRELQHQVELIRGLKFKTPVPYKMRTQGELSTQILEKGESESSSGEDDLGTSFFLERLALIPAGFDIDAYYKSLYSDKIRGLYDPKDATFYVVGNAVAAAGQFTVEEVVAAHELAHALDDQHFGLKDYSQKLSEPSMTTDLALATKSMVEGEARLVETEYTLKQAGLTLKEMPKRGRPPTVTAEEIAKAPPVLGQYLEFPYSEGSDFMLFIRKAGGWELVNKVWQDPPASTEQILHPKKYLDQRDHPDKILLNLPEQIQGWSQLNQDTGGEFMVRAFLSQHLGAAAGESAAAGWGGDVYRVYRQGDKTWAFWFLHYDSPGEGTKLAESIQRALKKMPAGSSVENLGRGNVVLYLGVPPDVKPLLAQAFERVSIDKAVQRVVVTRPANAPKDSTVIAGQEDSEPRYVLEDTGFTSVNHGFTLPIPEGWGAEPSKDRRLPVRLTRGSGKAEARFVVIRLPEDPNEKAATPKQTEADVQEQFAKEFRGFTVTGSKPIVLGGQKFLEVLATGRGMHYSVFYGKVLGRTYMILFIANDATYDEARPELLKALKGMQFRPAQ